MTDDVSASITIWRIACLPQSSARHRPVRVSRPSPASAVAMIMPQCRRRRRHRASIEDAQNADPLRHVATRGMIPFSRMRWFHSPWQCARRRRLRRIHRRPRPSLLSTWTRSARSAGAVAHEVAARLQGLWRRNAEAWGNQSAFIRGNRVPFARPGRFMVSSATVARRAPREITRGPKVTCQNG
jgi:hypothetical protein